MKKVERTEILDYVTYEEQRDKIRSSAMRAKDARRIHLGADLTFLFENTETIRYQVLEMVRAEQLVKEADIQHELDTYNELLPESGGLAATLLIEIENPEERDEKLHNWLDMPEKLFLELEDGSRVFAQHDGRQSDGKRISSVQFLKFDCGGKTPVKLGCDVDSYNEVVDLTEQQRSAFERDLS